jgi:hypothetical protein
MKKAKQKMLEKKRMEGGYGSRYRRGIAVTGGPCGPYTHHGGHLWNIGDSATPVSPFLESASVA